jgi:hypothetical protein
MLVKINSNKGGSCLRSLVCAFPGEEKAAKSLVVDRQNGKSQQQPSDNSTRREKLAN